jgi:rhamnosyltransferase subunit B
MGKVVFVAKGSYGDIFPLLSIADELRRHGHVVVFASYKMHKRIFASLDYPVVWIDGSEHKAAENLIGSNAGVFSRLKEAFVTSVLPSLKHASPLPSEVRREVGVLLSAAQDADLIVGCHLAYSGPIVAKMLGIKWVFCAFFPLAIPTYSDPSLFPYFHWLQRLSIGSVKLQKIWLSLARLGSRILLSSVIEQRESLGMSATEHPLFEGMYSKDLNLMLTSPLMVDQSPEWPSPTLITGFTWYEAEFLKSADKLARLEAFIAAGEPPIVFTLSAGAGGRSNPGRFFCESIKACESLGLRVIINANEKFHAMLPKSKNILMIGLVDYSVLFRRALAVVHSGGIGTIGWSLRYGVPSLIRPSSVDQFDNAYRLTKKGVVDTLARNRFKAPAIAESLNKLLGNSKRRLALQQTAQIVAAENGAKVACAAIERLFD